MNTETKKLRTTEMLRFENWLWEHYNPAEVFEDWAEKTTEAIFRLSLMAAVDPTDIMLPLSEDAIFNPIRAIHNDARVPLEERDANETVLDFYPGEALSDDELRWVALHIQSALIPVV